MALVPGKCVKNLYCINKGMFVTMKTTYRQLLVQFKNKRIIIINCMIFLVMVSCAWSFAYYKNLVKGSRSVTTVVSIMRNTVPSKEISDFILPTYKTIVIVLNHVEDKWYIYYWYKDISISVSKESMDSISLLIVEIGENKYNLTEDYYSRRSLNLYNNTYEYRLPKMVHYSKSNFSRFSEIRNWPGDMHILLYSIFKAVYYSVLSLIFLLVINIIYIKRHIIKNILYENRFYMYNLVVFTLIEIIFFIVVVIKNTLSFSDPFIYLYFMYRTMLDWLLYLSIVMLLIKLFKNKLLPILFSLFYIFLMCADIAIYLYNFTLFEKSFLKLVTIYSVMSYFNATTYSLIFFLLIVCIILSYTLNKMGTTISRRRIIVILLLCITVGILDFADRIIGYHVNSYRGKLGKYEYLEFEIKKKNLSYIRKNSFINFLEKVIFEKDSNPLRIISGLSQYKDIIDQYKLPFGKRQYANHGLKPFNKIVLFTSESMSLDLLTAYNENLTINTSGFYGSPDISRRMFTNIRTTAQPTLQGLSVLFHSHPNFDISMNGMNKYSLVKLLKDSGYKTIFLRSSTRNYAGENITFKKYGFDTIIASEDFAANPENRKYIYSWGVCDRLLYQKLIELLEKYKNDRVFITVLGVDMHPLDGRSDYKDLPYPKLPAGIDSYKSRKNFLKAVYYHDFDMGQTINTIKKRHLLTDDTLILLTADHACPYNSIVSQIKGMPENNLARIPLVFLSGQNIPKAQHSMMGSQLDIAPTILHLVNIPIPDGYWGNSLFSDGKINQFIGVDKGTLYIQTGDNKSTINVDEPANDIEKKFADLFNSAIMY